MAKGKLTDFFTPEELKKIIEEYQFIHDNDFDELELLCTLNRITINDDEN